MDLIRAIEQRIAYRFSDPDLLEQALTHRSHGRRNYERLEFLGDGLLNCIVGAALYRRRPQAEEGDLSRFRATLVKESTLAAIGAELGLADLIRFGPGELRSGGFRRRSIHADVIESIIGAVYLDGGFDAAEALVLRLFDQRLDDLPDAESLKDAKTRLQELLQGAGRGIPVYEVVDARGPAHQRQFTARCTLPDSERSVEGVGSSRRRAEQNAAALMIREEFGDA